MTHLIVAKNIIDKINIVHDLPQFFLGAVAPDAVHYRAGYVSDFKKASHLCVGSEKWGVMTNYGEWADSVITFYNKYKGAEQYDFILGYCAHILTDIYNAEHVWNPFRLEHPEVMSQGYGDLYHTESGGIDKELALTWKDSGYFWQNLAKSRGVDLPGVICADEIEKQKDNILSLLLLQVQWDLE